MHTSKRRNPMTSDQNKAIVRRFFDEFNKHEQSAYSELIGSDYLLDFPGGPGTAHGLGGLLQATQGFLATFPDLHFTLDRLVAEGDYVVISWTMHATQQGALGPVP